MSEHHPIEVFWSDEDEPWIAIPLLAIPVKELA